MKQADALFDHPKMSNRKRVEASRINAEPILCANAEERSRWTKFVRQRCSLVRRRNGQSRCCGPRLSEPQHVGTEMRCPPNWTPVLTAHAAARRAAGR